MVELPISFTEYLYFVRQREIMDLNVSAVDDWLSGKIDSEELKRRIKLPLVTYTN